ncbi:MAG: tetratricopeptide repeat protein [Bacteroidales bacterium]|nr:tetratricopeptide repeat protein [Candidatus Cacconaster merdequi]
MVKKMAVVAALFVGIAVTGYAQYDLDHFYYRGRQALIDGKYSEAIESFSILSRLDTTSYEAYFFRGIAKYNLSDLNGAQRDFDQALRLNPIYTPAYHYRAITLSRIGKFDLAIKDLEEAVDLRPSYIDLYFSRGVTYFLSQQFDKAIKDFNTYIRKEPKESDAYLNRGACYLYTGDTTKALDDYNKAISLNRTEAEGYVRRSRVYAMKDMSDEAIEDLNTAIRIDKDNTYAYFNRALLKYDKQDIAGALADLDKVLEDEPGNALTLYNRALIKAQVGEFTSALDDYDRVLNINPNNVLAYFNRASVFLELGRYRDAMDDYSQAINLYPDFAKAYMNRAYAKNQLGQYTSSKQDYEIAQKKIREYQAKTSDSTSYEAFADTSKQYSHLLALDADFAKKDFNNELLQYRDVDIRLKPLYKFTACDSAVIVSPLQKRYEDFDLDRFIAESPLNLKFSADGTVQTKNAKEMVTSLNKLIASQRKDSILFAKALLETDNKQYNSALACYDEAITQSPDNSYYYLNRGSLQAEMIDFISSIENNVQVLTLDNSKTIKTRVQDQVSRSYDYTSAIHDMTRAAELKPDFPFVYYNLGNLYCLSSDLPEAIVQYTKALELYPSLPEAYYNRGLVLIYLKDKEKGCIDLSVAGELGIDDAYSVIKKYCKTEEN